MARSAFLFTALLLGALVTWVPPVQAQTGIDIAILCSPTAIEIDVSPEGSKTGMTVCEIDNDRPSEITVKANVDSSLDTAHDPIDIPPFSTGYYPIQVFAEERAAEGNRQITVSMEMTHLNGVPLGGAGPESGDVQLMIVFKQFSEMRAMSKTDSFDIVAGEDENIEITVFNDGNNRDHFLFEVIDLEAHDDAGLKIEIGIENESEEWIESLQSHSFNFTIGIDGGWVGSPTTREVVIQVLSDHSVRSEETPVMVNISFTVDMTPSLGLGILGIEDRQTMYIVSALLIVGLLGVSLVIYRRLTHETIEEAVILED
jgi:hypothetical protein